VIPERIIFVSRGITVLLILSYHLRLGLPSGLITSGLPTKTPVCTSRVFHTCHKPRPSHSSRFYHARSIWWGVQIIKARVCLLRLSTLNVSLERPNSCDWFNWNKFKQAAVACVKNVIQQFPWRERQKQWKSQWEWLMIGPGFEPDAGLGLSWIASCI